MRCSEYDVFRTRGEIPYLTDYVHTPIEFENLYYQRQEVPAMMVSNIKRPSGN